MTLSGAVLPGRAGFVPWVASRCRILARRGTADLHACERGRQQAGDPAALLGGQRRQAVCDPLRGSLDIRGSQLGPGHRSGIEVTVADLDS